MRIFPETVLLRSCRVEKGGSVQEVVTGVSVRRTGKGSCAQERRGLVPVQEGPDHEKWKTSRAFTVKSWDLYLGVWSSVDMGSQHNFFKDEQKNE